MYQQIPNKHRFLRIAIVGMSCGSISPMCNEPGGMQDGGICIPLRMARSGAIALWCQTVMSRVQGNTINTMARISLLFGISRIGYVARHYLCRKDREGKGN